MAQFLEVNTHPHSATGHPNTVRTLNISQISELRPHPSKKETNIVMRNNEIYVAQHAYERVTKAIATGITVIVSLVDKP